VKILILKPSSLGDVVQALPVLRLLKQHLPASEIFWWMDSTLAPLLEGDPDLAGIVHFRRDRWAAPKHWLEIWHTVHWMRRQNFDWVIDLQSLLRSGVFAWLANGRFTIGLDDSREGARGFYDVFVPRGSYHTHAVDWYLEVLRRLEVPVHRNFTWLPEREAVARGIREKWQTDGLRWIILQPGARWMNKRWPVENFAELTRQLAASHPDFRFAVLGGADDRELGQVIARANPGRCLDLTGKISLLEMVEWIRIGALMVSNDTGPMHVAAALGKPLVAIFGPTEPCRTGPYGLPKSVLQASTLPCVPCMSRRCSYHKPMECLSVIPISLVLSRVEEQLR
jgi:lipopolysaccharide heptosyltransferase II